MGTLAELYQSLVSPALKAGEPNKGVVAKSGQELVANSKQVLKSVASDPDTQGAKAVVAGDAYKEHKSQEQAQKEARQEAVLEDDFTPFIIENDQKGHNTAPTESSPTGGMPLTGIRELDRKIKTRNLSLFDYYLAKNYLGINLGVYLTGSLELQQKIANRTKATSDIYETIKNLDLGDNIINKAQDNAGPINGVFRKINQISGGLVPLGAELAQTDTAVNQYTYSTARALTNGKVTNQTLEDLKHITRMGLRWRKEYTARLGETQNININFLTSQLHNLQALGGRITPDMLQKLAEYKAKARYIQQSGGDIDLSTYNKIGKGVR